MRIDKINIRNFKGFEDKEFILNPNFTVAIGNNGLGKSTLLHALQVGLGALLQSIPTLPANHLYRRQFKRSERYIKYYPERRDFLPNKENPLIIVESHWFDKNKNIKYLVWRREYLSSNVTTHKEAHSRQIFDYANFLFDNHGEEHELLYPVLANFQINRTNAQVKKVDRNWRRLSKLAKGYYAALGENVDFTGVYEWLYSYERSLKDKLEFDGTKEAMFTSIIEAIPYIKEIEYNAKYDEFEVLVDFQDDQPAARKLASTLSDGMKSMLHMVAEIAYRCIMLNGKLGSSVIKKSTGIVLIDELDMHLHPTWQMHVVSDLKRAFPNIQFVVTTHSPFIVQSLKEEELRILDESIKKFGDPLKKSLEDVTVQEMGVIDAPRSLEFKEMLKVAEEYFALIKQGKTSKSDKNALQLRKRLNELEEKFGEDPAFIASLKIERNSSGL